VRPATLTKKTLILLTVLTLVITLTTAQEITFDNPEENEYYTEDFLVDLETEDLDEDAEVRFEYTKDDEETVVEDELDGSEFSSDYEEHFSEVFEDWEDDYSEKGEYELNVYVDDEETDSVEFYYGEELPEIDGDYEVVKHSDGSISIEWSLEEDDDNVDYASYSDIEFELETDDTVVDSSFPGSSGEANLTDPNDNRTYESIGYTLRAVGVTGEGDDEKTLDTGEYYPLDGLSPEFSYTSLGDSDDLSYVEHINEDSTEVSVEVVDSLSGVSQANLTFENNESIFDSFEYEEEPNESVELDISLDNLEDGEYDLRLDVEDHAGEHEEIDENNQETYEWSFVVDTENPEPNVSLVPNPEDTEFITGRTSFIVEVEDSDSAIRARCYVNDVPHGADFGSADLEDDEFDCGRLDPRDYSEGSNDIYVRFEDKAGNRETKNLGAFIFDTENPEIDSFDITPRYTNEEPNVTVEASDTGSDITDAEYVFSENVDEGDGRNIDFASNGRSVDFEFQPDLANREGGEYDLFVRVRDQSGKWSDLEGNNFTLDREALPDPVIDFDEVEIEDGSEMARVDVSNEGDVPLVSTVLKVDGVVEGESEQFDVFGGEESSIRLNLTSDEEFGVYQENLTLESTMVDLDHEFQVNIIASDGEKSEVDERLDNVGIVLDYVEGNISQLEEEGASEEMLEELREEQNQLDSVYREAQSDVEEENYHEVASLMADLENYSNSVEEAQEEVIEARSREQRVFYVQMFALLMVLGGGTGIFALYRSDYELDMDEFDLQGLEFDLGFVNELNLASVTEIPGNILEQFEEFLEEEEEAATSYEDISWN